MNLFLDTLPSNLKDKLQKLCFTVILTSTKRTFSLSKCTGKHDLTEKGISMKKRNSKEMWGTYTCSLSGFLATLISGLFMVTEMWTHCSWLWMQHSLFTHWFFQILAAMNKLAVNIHRQPGTWLLGWIVSLLLTLSASVSVLFCTHRPIWAVWVYRWSHTILHYTTLLYYTILTTYQKVFV